MILLEAMVRNDIKTAVKLSSFRSLDRKTNTPHKLRQNMLDVDDVISFFLILFNGLIHISDQLLCIV